jgi:hypothetical protein
MSGYRCTKREAEIAIAEFVATELDQGHSLAEIIKLLRPAWTEPDGSLTQAEIVTLIEGVIGLRARQGDGLGGLRHEQRSPARRAQQARG